MQVAKDAIYRLTNHLQCILSYIEMEEYTKALKSTKEAIKELKNVYKVLAGVLKRTVSTGGAVVVPIGSRIVNSTDINIDVPVDEVRCVEDYEIREGMGDGNPRSK